MKEIWKPIEGYENYYMVSNTGKVKSLGNGKSNNSKKRILKGGKDGNGYPYVNLWKEGKVKMHKIHRLVAQAFCKNPKGYTEVNHIDENKENNCAENLEWCSRSYNTNYGTRNQKAGEKLKGRKFSEETIKKMAESKKKPVYSINKKSGLITYWESATDAGRLLGIDSSHISSCCKGKQKSSGGYYWHYASESEEVANEQE